MRGLGILLILVLFFTLVWPSISKWLKRKAMERAEDYMRRSMGMPPREKSRKKKAAREEYYQNQYGSNHGGGSRDDRYYRRTGSSEPLIPKEYAEDVEFTETVEYSSSTVIEGESVKSKGPKSKKKFETYHESQISDVEWTEIKKSGSK